MAMAHSVFLPDEVPGQSVLNEVLRLQVILQQLAHGMSSQASGAAVFSDPFAEQTRSAKRLVAERTTRAAFFDESLFGEAAWHLILDLYVSGREFRKVSVSSACIAARVPPTTALRCIKMLVAEGHIIRIPDMHDNRRVHLTLTPAIEEKMTDYLLALNPKAPSRHEGDVNTWREGRS